MSGNQIRKAKNGARCCDRDRAAKNRTHQTGRSRCWPFKEVSLQRVGEPRFLIRLWWVLATRARAKLFRPKMVDYYSVLDVTKAATTPEIKKA